MNYCRRQGIEWQNDLYIKLLTFIYSNNLKVDENVHETISNADLKDLSIAVFPKYGHRNAYQDKIRFFLKCYFNTINLDLPRKLFIFH